MKLNYVDALIMGLMVAVIGSLMKRAFDKGYAGELGKHKYAMEIGSVMTGVIMYGIIQYTGLLKGECYNVNIMSMF